MRRWNGWGDDRIDTPLPAPARAFVEAQVGPGNPPVDARLSDLVARVRPSRLPLHPLVSAEAAERVRHARGQSLPDWIALRSGHLPLVPDGVALPISAAEVRDLLQYARSVGAQVIPYGGGTSVVGHLTPLLGDAPVLTVALGRLNRLRSFDALNHLATFEAGVAGPDLEAHLRARGYTLGHFPQSFEFSTLGGWVATRSIGQQSLGYGGIEQRFAGGRLETPVGTLEVPTFPASAAGLDLREVVLGSEGRLGILVEAAVRILPLPEQEAFHAVFFPTWEQGVQAARALVQAGLPLTMVRLSNAIETQTNLALAGHEWLIGAMQRYLALRGQGAEKCLALLGFAGSAAQIKHVRRQALRLTNQYQGLHFGRTLGNGWRQQRFRTPYLRNQLWTLGYAVDTIETATTWTHIPAMVSGIERALREGLAEAGEHVHVFTHLSHLYQQGACSYTTYLFRQASDPEETLHRWQKLKAAASQVIHEHRGTISHHHGVGTDHQPYLEAEKGPLGIAAMRQFFRTFDPEAVMNPGKLV